MVFLTGPQCRDTLKTGDTNPRIPGRGGLGGRSRFVDLKFNKYQLVNKLRRPLKIQSLFFAEYLDLLGAN